MQIDIRPEVFSEASYLPRIMMLLQCVQEGRHFWVADEDAIPIVESYLRDNVPHLADAYISLAKKGLVGIQWVGAMERPSIVAIQAADLDDIAHDLARSAVLVVEDKASDGSFIRALCQIFGAARLLEALSQGWIEIRHSGGSGRLPMVAEEEVENFKHCVRVAVLLDSDRLIPGEQTPAHGNAEKLRSIGAVVHVLELREIENYIPNRALAAFKPMHIASYRLRHLKRLTSDQRGVYDMKKGFGPASGSAKVHPRQSGVFGMLDPETMRGLRAGFGDNIVTQVVRMADTLTERDFRSIGVGIENEIIGLLQGIASVI
jgi:hypothetical protein